jgi:hypothetical protein
LARDAIKGDLIVRIPQRPAELEVRLVPKGHVAYECHGSEGEANAMSVAA